MRTHYSTSENDNVGIEALSDTVNHLLSQLESYLLMGAEKN